MLYKQILGKRLREKRMEHGLTQSKMSEYLDIQVRSYQRYEEGSNFPSLEILIKLCDILGISADYLLCRDGFLKSREASSNE